MPSAARRVCACIARGAQLRLEIRTLRAAQMAGVVSIGTRVEQYDAGFGSKQLRKCIRREDRCMRHEVDRIAWQNAPR